MTGRLLAPVILALAATGLATPAVPQDVNAPCRLCDVGTARADEKPAAPVRLGIETRLDFDRLILAGSGHGSAELSPDGGRSVAGSVATIGLRAMAGQVSITGEPGRAVRISLPERIELSGINGGTVRLESIRSDLPAIPRLDGQGRLTFRFGGILRLSGEVDGEFRGEVPSDVEYF
jgi:hypothetical protein